MEEEEDELSMTARGKVEKICKIGQPTSSTEKKDTTSSSVMATISVQSSNQAVVRQHGVIITQQQPSDDDSDTVENASDGEDEATVQQLQSESTTAAFLGQHTSQKSTIYSSQSTENVLSWKTSTQLTSSAKSFLMSHAKSEETSPNMSPTRGQLGHFKSGATAIYSTRSSENVASWKETQQLDIRSSSSKGSSLSSQEDISPTRGLKATRSVETSSVGQEGRQWLTTAAGRTELARSMESLRTTVAQQQLQNNKLQTQQQQHHHHRQSFLTSSERDMRRVVATSVEARSLESLEREIRLKRRAVSGEEEATSPSEEALSAERRRGLYAVGGERRTPVPSHLSLLATPAPPDRRLTILSPHSPMAPQDLLQWASLKTRRKKAVVLPKLILPRSESDVFMDFTGWRKKRTNFP